MLAVYLLLIQFCIVIFQEWRNEEMALIDELYSGPERKAALVGLLEQEAHLIASIDRHKLVADEENRDKRIKSFLNKVLFNLCVFVMSCNLQPDKLKTAHILRRYHWFPPQNSEFMHQEGRKKRTTMCEKRDRAITYVFFGDLHLTYCFLVFYKKTCLKDGEVPRKSFQAKFLSSLSHKVSVYGHKREYRWSVIYAPY